MVHAIEQNLYKMRHLYIWINLWLKIPSTYDEILFQFMRSLSICSFAKPILSSMVFHSDLMSVHRQSSDYL